MRTFFEPDDVSRLREALIAADYTEHGFDTRLSSVARSDAGREDFRSVLGETSSTDHFGVLLRLFMCGMTVPRAHVVDALAPLNIDVALNAGLLTMDGDGLRAAMSLALYDGCWVLADLPAGAGRDLDIEHVLGVGGASRSLSEWTLREPVESALDIGTGCGVQALGLSAFASTVTATDVSGRALAFAALNAQLNQLDWELLEGDMAEPVMGRRFDLVVSNPPFVVGGGDKAFTYRDSGRQGDQISAELASSVTGLLNPGGTLQFLSNWLHVEGEDWRDRVSGWFAGTGCDVWAVQRELCDPLDYVRVWQRDSHEVHDPQKLAAWLDWFDRNRVVGVGFGVITARANGSVQPVVSCEDLRHGLAEPWRDNISAWLNATQSLNKLGDTGLLDARLLVADDVRLNQEAVLSAEGWDVDQQIIHQLSGMRRREEIDPLFVSFLAGCQGHVTTRTLIGLLANAHEAPEALLAASMLPTITRLVQHGYLLVEGTTT